MPLRILLVEDNADVRESLAVLLRLNGFQVDTASGRDEALAAFRCYPPDVVLMDLGLPGCDGYQVTRELRGLCPAKPLLVALTGHAQEEYRRRSVEEGFDYHCLKPVDPAWLVQLLGEFGLRRRVSL
jgi:two-component system CheB/CheR fusion protein